MFVTSILYHVVMIIVLCIYTFAARQVFTETLLAATSLYLVLGSGFAAIFALIEWLQPGSFTSSAGAVASWQELLYFSYITLTSLGYGDILPVKYYAQAFEAIIGVLYSVLLLSQLVGMHTLYAPSRRKRSIKTHPVIVICAGLALLAVFYIVGGPRGGAQSKARAMLAFILVWLCVSLVNMGVGVLWAGYSVAQEAPFLIGVFGVPALMVWLIRTRTS